MAGSSGNAEFIYQVGVDLTEATSELRDWASKTVPSMLSTKPIVLKIDTEGASASVRQFAATAQQALRSIPALNLKIDTSGLSRGVAAVKELEASIAGLNRASLGGGIQNFAHGTGELRENLRSAGVQAALMSEQTERVTASAERSSAAMDYLGKIALVDTAKILAFGAAFSLVDGTIHGFADALKQAGEVQMEQTLQRLYSGTIDVNQALQNAIVIAKTWGGNIVDVQQAIGLWTKQTNDLALATMLAAKGEELARASGMQTAEVYRDSLAIGEQMGLTYSQLPAVYDQVSRASLRLGEVLRGVNERSSNGNEAMKDLFHGLAEASATLAANGFTNLNDKLRGTASIIAIIAAQIQATGESGTEAAEKLSTLFGALDQGGPKRGTWEQILGVDAFKDADHLLGAIGEKLKTIEQANADGKLGVRPQSVETLATFEKNLKAIDEIYKDIAESSKGSLDIVALSEMATYQAQVDRLKTSIQALEITFGNQLLPTMQGTIQWLADQGIPSFEHLVPTLEGVSKQAALLGTAWLALQAGLKLDSGWNAIQDQISRTNLAIKANVEAEALAQRAGFQTASAMGALQAKLAALDAAQAEDAASTKLLAAAYAQLGSEAGLTTEQLARLNPEQVAAGEAADAARDQITNEAVAAKNLQMNLFAAGEQMALFTDAETKAVGETDLLTASTTRLADSGSLVEGGMGRASAGIGILAAGAARALGPLAAIYGVMQAISMFSEAQNKDNDLTAGIQARASNAQAQRGILSSGFGQNMQDMHDDILGAFAYLSGKGNAFGSVANGTNWIVPSQLDQNILRNPEFGQQYNNLKGQYFQEWSRGDSTSDTATAIADLVRRYKANGEAVQGVTTSFDRLQKFLAQQAQQSAHYAQDSSRAMGAADAERPFYQAVSKAGSGSGAVQQVNATAQAYDALAKKQQDAATAADADIRATELEIKANGASQSLLNQLQAAFYRKEQAYSTLSAATNSYVKSLQAEISHDEEELSNGKLSAAQKKQYSEALVKAENDLTKAEGDAAAAAARHREAMAEADTAMATYALRVVEARNGITDWSRELKTIESALSSAKANGLAPWISSLDAASGQLGVMQAGLRATLRYVEQRFPHATNIISQLKDALQQVSTEMTTVGTDTATATGKVDDMVAKLQELNDSLLEGNLKDVASVLGYNKQTIEYLTQSLDINKQIAQLTQQILDDYKELGNLQGPATAQQQQQLSLAIQLGQADLQELNTKRQIANLENQILAIRSNPLYTAYDSEIDKMGSEYMDKWVQKLFGGGGATGGMQVFHQFFSGVADNLVGSLWKNVSENISTSLMGGSSPVQQLQDMETKLQATVAQGFNPAVTTFGTYVTNFSQSVNNLGSILTGQSSNVGTGNLPGVNPSGFSWAGVPDLGPGGSGFQATEQEYGITNPLAVGQSYDSIQTIEANTTQANTYLATMATNSVSAASTLNQAVATPGGLSLFSTTGSGPDGLLLDAGFSPSGLNLGSLGLGGGSAGSSGGIFGSVLSMLGLGGGGGGGASGGLSGLASLFTGSVGGNLFGNLLVGSLLGGILGSNNGKAGTSQHEIYGMAGATLLGGGAFALEALITNPAFMAALGPFAPVLPILGALLGGFGGSLFGDHFPISDEPDIGEPVVGGVNYGQFVANMTGESGSFNGQTMNPFSQYSGPQDAESYQLEQDVQKVLGSPSQYPSQLVQLAHQLQQYNPGNEPYGFSINSEKNDVFTLHSGAQVNVQTYQGLVQQFMQLFGKQGPKQLAPILSINGAASPNWYNTPGLTNSEFTQMEQSSWGSYSSSTPYNVPGYSGGGSSGSSGSPPIVNAYGGSMPYVGSGSGGNGGNVTVQLLVNGKILAQIVNSYNAQYLLNSGKSISQVPVL